MAINPYPSGNKKITRDGNFLPLGNVIVTI